MNRKDHSHLLEKRIALIGAGNVAYHIAQTLIGNGFNLCQIYSRSIDSAVELSRKTGITYTTNIQAIYPDCDIYLFAVSDDAIGLLSKEIHCNENALFIHTSGSISMDIFSECKSHYGVLYPLQTFTKKRNLDFREIPLLIEGNDEATFNTIQQIAEMLSNQVECMDSAKRQKLHLAAVMVNNFTNHLYDLAGNYLQSENIEAKLLRPLIYETAHKVMTLSPREAQTGPAKRGDKQVLNSHRTLLHNNPEILKLYNFFSDSILKAFEEKEEQNTKKEQQYGEMLTLW